MSKKLSDLVDKVYSATRTRKLAWQEEYTGRYVANLNDEMSFRIYGGYDSSDGTNWYELEFRERGRGETLDSCRYTDFDAGYSKLKEIYETARRMALNVETRIEEAELLLQRLAV